MQPSSSSTSSSSVRSDLTTSLLPSSATFPDPSPAPSLTNSSTPHGPEPTARKETSRLFALLPPRWHKAIGIILVAASAFAFSVMSLLVKVVGKTLPSFELVFVRCMVQLVCVMGYMAYYRVGAVSSSWPTSAYLKLLMRGVSGIGGISSIYFAVQYLPLGDSQALFFSSAVFAGIAGWCVLGEPFSVTDFGLAAIAMVGVVFVAQPESLFGSASGGDANPDVSTQQRYVAIALALLGAVCAVSSYLSIRALGKGYHYQLHTLYFAGVGVLTSPIMAKIVGQELRWFSGPAEALGALSVGLCGFLGQTLVNAGMQQLDSTATGGLIRLTDVLYAYMFQITILHDTPLPLSIVGALIISSSVGLTTLRKMRAAHSAHRDGHTQLIEMEDFDGLDSSFSDRDDDLLIPVIDNDDDDDSLARLLSSDDDAIV